MEFAVRITCTGRHSCGAVICGHLSDALGRPDYIVLADRDTPDAEPWVVEVCARDNIQPWEVTLSATSAKKSFKPFGPIERGKGIARRGDAMLYMYALSKNPEGTVLAPYTRNPLLVRPGMIINDGVQRWTVGPLFDETFRAVTTFKKTHWVWTPKTLVCLDCTTQSPTFPEDDPDHACLQTLHDLGLA